LFISCKNSKPTQKESITELISSESSNFSLDTTMKIHYNKINYFSNSFTPNYIKINDSFLNNCWTIIEYCPDRLGKFVGSINVSLDNLEISRILNSSIPVYFSEKEAQQFGHCLSLEFVADDNLKRDTFHFSCLEPSVLIYNGQIAFYDLNIFNKFFDDLNIPFYFYCLDDKQSVNNFYYLNSN
jgi:hypothetical protein